MCFCEQHPYQEIEFGQQPVSPIALPKSLPLPKIKQFNFSWF